MVKLKDVSFKTVVKELMACKNLEFLPKKIPKDVYVLWAKEFCEMEAHTKWESEFDYQVSISEFIINKHRAVPSK